MDIRDYLDSARGVVALPPGHYVFDQVIPWTGLTITSENPLQPASIERLKIYGDGVNVHNLTFSDSKKAYDKTALEIRGWGCTVKICQFLPGYQFGIAAERKALIQGNTIFGFSDDAIQFCGDGTRILNNTIGLLASEIRKDKAHKDGIQGWAGDVNSPFRNAGRFDAVHELVDIEISGNHLIDKPNSPLQGITFFDGLARDWVVTDNTIQLYGPHPLTILGLQAGVVDRNILIDGQQTQLLPARRWLADLGRWQAIA